MRRNSQMWQLSPLVGYKNMLKLAWIRVVNNMATQRGMYKNRRNPTESVMAAHKSTSRLWRLHFMQSINRLRSEGILVDFHLHHNQLVFPVHSIIISAFLPSAVLTVDHWTLLETELEWGVFIDSLYDLNTVTPELYRTKLQPLARLLKIKFLCDVKYSMLKDRFLLQEHLVTLWLEVIFSHLENCFLTHQLCDCDLNVQGENIKIHKSVLAAVSPFFESMFTLEMRESQTMDIKLHEINDKTLKELLLFIYSGKNILNTSNVESMLTLASYLQISRLQEKCEKFIIRNMDSENVLGIHRLSQMCDSDYLHQRSLDYILNNISQVSRSEEFMALNASQIKQIVDHKSVNIKDMSILFDSLLVWFTSGNRSSMDLLSLMSALNLCQLESSKLSSVLRDNRTLQRAPECQVLIKKTLLIKAENDPCFNVKKKTSGLLVIRSSCYSAGLHATVFSLESKKWYQLASLCNYETGNGFASCRYGENVYVCGGSGNFTGMCSFSFLSNAWTIQRNMTNERSDHVLCNIGQELFVLGGRNHTLALVPTIEKCDTNSLKWSTIGELTHPVFGASGVAVGHHIYMFGGCLSFSDYTDIIQCFDVKTCSSYVVSRLPTQCSFGAVTTHEDEVFIIGPRGHVISYDGDSHPEILGTIHNSSCMGFTAIKHKHQLWVIGGYSSTTESLDIRSFDLHTRKSVIMKRMVMPWPRMSNQYCCCLVFIDDRHLQQELSHST